LSNFPCLDLDKMKEICDEIIKKRRSMKNIKEEDKNLVDIVLEADDLYKTNEEVNDIFYF